jgi:hypothetical protein
MDYRARLLQRLRGLPLQAPPLPWRRLCVHAVGGLTEVGFASGTDLLLVVSSTGRGVFDCATGERVARDYGGIEHDWYDPVRLTARGIGPLEGQVVRIGGLLGGGLPLTTADGWGITMVFPDWPDGFAVLEPPGSSVFVEHRAGPCCRLLDVDEPRA